MLTEERRQAILSGSTRRKRRRGRAERSLDGVADTVRRDCAGARRRGSPAPRPRRRAAGGDRRSVRTRRCVRSLGGQGRDCRSYSSIPPRRPGDPARLGSRPRSRQPPPAAELEASVTTNSPPIRGRARRARERRGHRSRRQAREGRHDARRRTRRSRRFAPCAPTCSSSVYAACIRVPDHRDRPRGVDVKRSMIANAAEVVAVSSADKLGSAGPYVIAPLEELDASCHGASPHPRSSSTRTARPASRSCSPYALDAHRQSRSSSSPTVC